MIKNIVLFVFSGLALFLTYTTVRYGLDLSGKLPVVKDANAMSVSMILEQGDVLNEKLDKLEDLNENDMKTAERKVQTEAEGYKAKKAAYERLENSASEYEIAEANKKTEYLLDYLWIVVGNYANDNNVKFKMVPDSVDNRLDFDITGSYVSIINFIYDLENDRNLNFRLNGIKMASSSSSDTTKAQFSVSGVRVITSGDSDTVSAF